MEPSDSRRCKLCLGLDKPAWVYEARDVEYSRKSSGSFGHVIISAHYGCAGCQIIAEMFHEHIPDSNQLRFHIYVHPSFPAHGSTLRPRIAIAYPTSPVYRDRGLWSLYHRGDPTEDMSEQRELFISPGHAGPSPHTLTADNGTGLSTHLTNAHNISGDTGSDAAVFRVKSWLSSCLENHVQCRTSLRSVLPTRVLLLEGLDRVRLYETQGEVAPYAALSHRWGQQPLLQTRRTTVEQHRQGISWASLPKTFRDAISFTYRLGIVYLWIDSLCIIQDSTDDWRREGSRMSSIYQNATLTLAAVVSADASGGCYAVSDPKHVSQELSLTKNYGSFKVFHRSPLPHVLHQDSLDNRGWAFQERLLSPRMVRFENQEIRWECREVLTCECAGSAKATHDKDFERQVSAYKCLRTSNDVQKLEKAWETLVSAYSGKALTKAYDIFPALQGLAKIVPTAMGDYLAGHWRSTLIRSLLWTPATSLYPGMNRLKHSKAHGWRAPTWSWASFPGQVDWGNPRRSYVSSLCQVKRAWTIPRGDDPTGQLVCGTLVIQGRCMSGRIADYTSDKARQQFIGQIDFGIDTKHDYRKVAYETRVLWDYDISTKGEHHLPIGAEVKALRIAKNIAESWIIHYWLLLHATELGSYARIGLLYTCMGQVSSVISPGANADIERAAVEVEVTIV